MGLVIFGNSILNVWPWRILKSSQQTMNAELLLDLPAPRVSPPAIEARIEDECSLSDRSRSLPSGLGCPVGGLQ
jgi:hypothetical protein